MSDYPSVARQGRGAWQFLAAGFRAPPPQLPSAVMWARIVPLLASYQRFVDTRRARLTRELAEYGLGEREPLLLDWNSFRPLVLGREEAWSDWLAFLLGTGDHEVRSKLFDLPSLPQHPPKVRREVVIPLKERARDGNYRADVILSWGNEAIHLEVKTGDPDLEKTWGEAKLIAERDPKCTFHHFILALPEQAKAFEATRRRQAPESRLVRFLTWEHVSRVLRTRLRGEQTATAWSCLATAFVGAIDQLLLFRPQLTDDHTLPAWWSPHDKEPFR